MCPGLESGELDPRSTVACDLGFLRPRGPVFDTKPTLKALCGIVRVIDD